MKSTHYKTIWPKTINRFSNLNLYIFQYEHSFYENIEFVEEELFYTRLSKNTVFHHTQNDVNSTYTTWIYSNVLQYPLMSVIGYDS